MNKTSIVEQVLDAVQVELMKSDLKYGELRNQIFVPHNMHIDSFRNYTLMIPSETNAKAIVDRHAKDGNVSWAQVLIEEVCEAVEAKTHRDMYYELIQVAAVAANMAAHLKVLIEIEKKERSIKTFSVGSTTVIEGLDMIEDDNPFDYGEDSE